MCAEYERVERVVQNDVWSEEADPGHSAFAQGNAQPVEGRMVKKFRRAAAGLEEQLPSDLRPPLVLKKTCDYLFNEIVREGAKLAKVHHFVWDRTRAVRNDFSIQQLTKVDDLRLAIDCLERIARFHIVSLHHLALEQRAYDKYDAQQEREQLDRTLLSLMQYYDDSRGRMQLENEAEFRAYCILFQLQDPIPDMEDRAQAWPRHVTLDHRVRIALDVYAAACNTMDGQGPLKPRATHLIAQQDWQKFWNLVASKQVGYLMGCVAEIYFNLVRRTALQGVYRGFRMGATRSPDDFTSELLMAILQLDNEDQVIRFCESYGFSFKQRASDGVQYLDLASVQGLTLPAPAGNVPKQWKSVLVEDKRFSRTLPSIINGLSVQEAVKAGMMLEEEQEDDGIEDMLGVDAEFNDHVGKADEGDSLFVPEEHTTEEPNPRSLTNEAGEKPTFGAPSYNSLRGTGQISSIEGKPAASFNFLSGQTAPALPTSSPAPKNPPRSIDFTPHSSSAGFTPSTFSFKPQQPVFASREGSEQGETASSFPRPPQKLQVSSTSFLNLVPSQTPRSPVKQSEKPKSFGSVSPFASTPPGDQNSLEQPVPLPATFGGVNSASFTAASAPPAQPEAKHPEDRHLDSQQQQLPQFTAPASPSQSHAQLPQQPPAPSSGLSGRKASQSHQPRKPSPLVHSVSIDEDDGQTSSVDGQDQTRDRRVVKELFPPATVDTRADFEEATSAHRSPLQPFPQQSPQSTHQQPDLATIVARIADEFTNEEPHGIISHYVQWVAQKECRNAKAQVTLERDIEQADLWRRTQLQKKFGRRWRAFFWASRFAKSGVKRRARARKGLEESRRSLDSSESGSVMGSLQSVEQAEAERQRLDQQYQASTRFNQRSHPIAMDLEPREGVGSKRLSSSQDQAANGRTRPREQMQKRMKGASHVDRRGRVAKPTPNDPNAETLKRASFLGFSMPVTAERAVAPPARRSNYFRLKAAGVDTWSEAKRGTKRKLSESDANASPALSVRASPQQRSSSPDTQALRMSALMKTTTATPSFEDSARRPSTAASNVDLSKGGDDDILARARRAREALAQGGKDWKDEFFMEEVKKEEIRKSMRSSTSSGESPSMIRARIEARQRASHGSPMSTKNNVSASMAGIPAYRLRESKFVPREQYGKAIERSKEMRASRSREVSRPASPTAIASQLSQQPNFDFASPGQPTRLSDVNTATLGQTQWQPSLGSQSQSKSSANLGTDMQTALNAAHFAQSNQPAVFANGSMNQKHEENKQPTQQLQKPNAPPRFDLAQWQPSSTLTERASRPAFKLPESQASPFNFSTQAPSSQSALGSLPGNSQMPSFGFGAQPRSPATPAQELVPLPQQDDGLDGELSVQQPRSLDKGTQDFTVEPDQIDDSLSHTFGKQPSQSASARPAGTFARPQFRSKHAAQPSFPSFGEQNSSFRQDDSYMHTGDGEVDLVSDVGESQPPYAMQFAQNNSPSAGNDHQTEKSDEASTDFDEQEAEPQESYQYSSNPYASLALDAGGDTEEDMEEGSDGDGYGKQGGYDEGEYRDEDEDEDLGMDGDAEDTEDFDEEEDEELLDDEETVDDPASSFRHLYPDEDDVYDPNWRRPPDKNPALQHVGGTEEEAIELSD